MPAAFRTMLNPSGETDPNFSSVSVLLHMDGTNGSTTFVDSGPNALAVTAVGGAQITSSSKYGTGAGSFSTGARLDVTSNAVFAFPGDFTFETWFYLTSINSNYNQIGPNVNVSGGLSLYYTGPAGYFGLPANSFVISNRISNIGTVSQALNLNQWYHLALIRSGSTMKLFLDGNTILTATSTYSFAQGALTIAGNTDNTSHSVNGRLDDFRITKGVARYTANFTAPTAAFPDS